MEAAVFSGAGEEMIEYIIYTAPSIKKIKKITLKEIRLSVRIGQHDLDFKAKQALEFLGEGHPPRRAPVWEDAPPRPAPESPSANLWPPNNI